MMNVFQMTYETRLQHWYDLRNTVSTLDLKDKCVMVDAWWQKAPLVNHHLHTADLGAWPDPWELLVDNTYCTVARALGMCYTLYMTGTDDVSIAEARDHQANDVVLVLVDNAKYVLNYWPDSVLNICLADFTITHRVDITEIIRKIG